MTITKQSLFDTFKTLTNNKSKISFLTKMKKLKSSTERNTKRQLRKKIRKAEYMKDFWEDLEELI